MKLPNKTLVLLSIMIGLVLSLSIQVWIASASGFNVNPGSDLTATPVPAILEPTPTVDPATIGDTSGVIALGMIVVIIILAGVLIGSQKLRQETMKKGRPED